MPPWVGDVRRRLVFAWTMAVLYPRGRYVPPTPVGDWVSRPLETDPWKDTRFTGNGPTSATKILWMNDSCVGSSSASLVYLGISMLGGLLMALQLTHWNPLQGMESFSGQADGAHECRGHMAFSQQLSGDAPLDSTPSDVAAGRRQPSFVVFHLRGLATGSSGRAPASSGPDAANQPWVQQLPKNITWPLSGKGLE